MGFGTSHINQFLLSAEIGHARVFQDLFEFESTALESLAIESSRRTNYEPSISVSSTLHIVLEEGVD